MSTETRSTETRSTGDPSTETRSGAPGTGAAGARPAGPFPEYDLDTAPAAARRSMEGVVRHLGYLPAPVARLAGSPQLLEAFLKSNALFEATSLDPLAREVVVMAVATRNGCHVCVALHTARLAGLGADAELVAALREQRRLPDERLEALRGFVLEVMTTAGEVPEAALDRLLGHGFTPQQALETVLGVGTYTLSTFANRLTRAPLDARLQPYAWTEPAA